MQACLEFAIEQTAGAELVRTEVLGSVARAAYDVGIEPESPALGEVTARAAELGFGD